MDVIQPNAVTMAAAGGDADADSDADALRPRPRTLTVLGVLVVAAGVLSYLGAYAVTNALLAAEVLERWPAGTDPRPRWLLTCFVSLLLGFAAAAMLFRVVSRRQLRRLDALADDE